MTKDNTMTIDAKQLLNDQKREAYFEQQQARLDEWTAEVEKLKAKTSRYSASAKESLLQKIDNQLKTLQEARNFVHTKLMDVQDASSEQWSQLVEESEDTFDQLSGKIKGFVDEVNAAVAETMPTQKQDQA
ncbi:MAG: hypothetical protein HQ527_10195 [Cyanobacteria bacterium]|nr:hypothetical protein [Cyanobacteria bacterium bin.51]